MSLEGWFALVWCVWLVRFAGDHVELWFDVFSLAEREITNGTGFALIGGGFFCMSPTALCWLFIAASGR